MASKSGVLISVEEYLHTTYRPDCDYVDDCFAAIDE